MKKIGVILVLLLSCALFLTSCQMPQKVPEIESKEVVIYEFYGQGCPYCTKMNKWFEEVKPRYPTLKVVQHEVYSDKENRAFFQQMSQAYGKKAGGVPVVFIGEKRIVGFSKEIGEQIEAEIKSCIEQVCPSPVDKLE
jgi:glutaredoxin